MGKYKALAQAVNMLDEERARVKELQDQVAILRRQVRQAGEREMGLLSDRAKLMAENNRLRHLDEKKD